MVLNAAVQMLREADDLKQKILKFKSGTSMLQERSLWVTQQQLQKVYQKVLVLDLDYALDKKVEQDLWNIGFKQQIEALQAISKDRKNALRSEGQAMLSWVLQAAAGFYLCLLHQICTTFKLDLPFRRRASLLGWVEGWGAGAGEGLSGARLPPPAAARYICQHCLVHLGDLARYRQQLRIAHTFYRHALVVSAHSGQPYNQLALVAWRRGRRLSAIYWHVRSLLVRAPFPPAPANLARTLAAAAPHSTESKDLPVIPGLTSIESADSGEEISDRLDAHTYINELIRALHLIHSVEQLDTATSLVNSLNSSLTALIATDSFESMTLIKMAVVIIWIVHSSSDDLKVESSALSEAEARSAQLAAALAAGALLALLLPNYTAVDVAQRTAPPLKVWLEWVVGHPQMCSSAAWLARPQLWPAVAHTLNGVAGAAHTHARAHSHLAYASIPLPEDEELHGFLPLEDSFKELKFSNHATWDTYDGRIPDVDPADDDGNLQSSTEVSTCCLNNDPELEHKVRSYRLVQLGKKLADLHPDHLTYTEEEGLVEFVGANAGGEQLSLALAELSLAGLAGLTESTGLTEQKQSEEGPAPPLTPPPPPPLVISEADFREKVREKRVGILKPQGSLERAREERALANTQDDQETEGSEESSRSEDKKEPRKPRVNIAMAAIMRKQEETNKQVKFVTPPPTPDSIVDTNDTKDLDKPKIIQSKALKSLANLPIGRKTGGILSLKDKSAGYPHLVNVESEPAKKPEKDEKKDAKPNQSGQSYQQKRLSQDHLPLQTWGPNAPQPYNDARMQFQKNYGPQNAGGSYNPSYQSPTNQGIRLPVVNPKEIDVRTAALQKQNSRQDAFQDGHKFGGHGYQMSGDKKNFLNDLPPRFANQYRYWQNAQDNQFGENKFRDDKSSSLFNVPASGWSAPPAPTVPTAGATGAARAAADAFRQPLPWWKPDNPPPSFGAYSQAAPNYYAQMPSAASNPYQNMQSYATMPNQGVGQKAESAMPPPTYLQSIGQPQLQTLQNLVASPNFNSSIASFGSYAPPVGYDSSMYPQFGNKLGYQPLQMKMMDKPQGYQGKDLMDMAVGFAPNVMDMQHRTMNMNFNSDMRNVKNLDQSGVNEGPSGEAPGNTYSLFSGAQDTTAWPTVSAPTHPPAQSLWSGPGPSPLERLLEQQKQMKHPPAPQ